MNVLFLVFLLHASILTEYLSFSFVVASKKHSYSMYSFEVIQHAKLREIGMDNNITGLHRSATTTTIYSRNSKGEILSDMDMMCIMNAAELCNYYEECDIEQREAFINSLDEQMDLLTYRLAMLRTVKKNLFSPPDDQFDDRNDNDDADRDGLMASQIDSIMKKIEDLVGLDDDSSASPATSTTRLTHP